MRPSLSVRGHPSPGGVGLSGLKLSPSPSARHAVLRRRLAAVACALALGVAGGLLGLFSPSHGPAHPAAATGPFSYFPT